MRTLVKEEIMFQRLVARILGKIIIERMSQIEKKDYITKRLDRLYENKKVRIVWP